MTQTRDPLAQFAAPTKAWFRAAFGDPTPVQVEAWRQIRLGSHALVIAPTGSGKTLAAFLQAVDRLMRIDTDNEPVGDGVKVLYVSPLKALGVDVERNLRQPLQGIATTAASMGVEMADVRVGVRSGDTPTNERRRLTTHPPQILITTPESLFLMLSSSALAGLTRIETVILDEIHYLAGTKRGAHLALSLERLDAVNSHGGFQRIGLSATVRPPETVAQFLVGRERGAVIVAPPTTKSWRLDVRVPVDDMTTLAVPVASARAKSSPDKPKPSIWPHVEQEIFDLVMAHRSTICFCNSRGVAERLTNHLNALYHEAFPDDGETVIARTHHGSIAKGLRADIEAQLKAGQLPCVVATNSLELGIDMGAVDLVIQVGAPPSVASGLQRIGRGGHQVSAISHGVLLPLSRSDLLTTAVVTKAMSDGEIEKVHRLINPLDVLAQHLVSMCLDEPQKPDNLFDVAKRSDPFADLPRRAFDSVVDMLTGKYPSDDFAEFRPRLTWDRVTDTLAARPGARRLVTTSGGTIPDRGLYGVFIAGGSDGPSSGKHAVSRRVGELDEEMVYESRLGDVFTLGTSAWRIEEITANQVIVTPVPGQTGRIPFWHGDEMSRSAELGHAIQCEVAELGKRLDQASPASVTVRTDCDKADEGGQPTARVGDHSDGAPSDPGLAKTGTVDQPGATVVVDPRARLNLLAYIKDQRAATAVLPDDRTILVERNQDEMGAWRVCVHCQLGRAVLQPWAMIIQRNLREATGLSAAPDPRLFITDDGITIRLGEVGNPSIGHLLGVDPADVERIVAHETQHSALFTAHFRQCAARALLLPRRDPGKRSPLWQQRLRATQLLGVAASYPDFPIVAEALRECLNDVFDLDPLRQLMSDIASRTVKIVEVETPTPSPFASSLLFGYTGAFMYDYDQPLAERAAAADWVDPALLAQLLGADQTTLIDDATFATVEARLQRVDPARRAQTMEALWDLLRELGPLTLDECRARCVDPPDGWLEELTGTGRIEWVTIGSQKMVAVSQDVTWLTSPLDESDLQRLVRRWMRHHTVVTPDQIATRYDVTELAVSKQLDCLVDEGLVNTDRYIDRPGRQFIDKSVLARARRQGLAKLRASIKPVPQIAYASFLMKWLELDSPGQGMTGLADAIDQVAGYPLPASMLESIILPARVTDYQPGMLDQLLSTEEVRWTGHGGIGDKDGWVCLWPTDVTSMLPGKPVTELTAAARAVADRLSGGGAWTIDALSADLVDLTPTQVDQAIWELVWAGWVSSDSFAPVRLLTQAAGVLHRPHVPRTRRVMRPLVAPRVARIGRWFTLAAEEQPEVTALVQAMGLELSRYGIVTKGSVVSEAMTPSFFNAYRVLSAMEGQVGVRRGYFIDGLGAAQFALTGAVDRLRQKTTTGLILLAACDPANPWGAALPWPQSMGHRPTRKAGAIVVLDDGRPVIYLERGAHTLVTFDTDRSAITESLRLVGTWIDDRRLDTVTVQRINSESALEAHDWREVLEDAGFTMTPQGFRRRPSI